MLIVFHLHKKMMIVFFEPYHILSDPLKSKMQVFSNAIWLLFCDFFSCCSFLVYLYFTASPWHVFAVLFKSLSAYTIVYNSFEYLLDMKFLIFCVLLQFYMQKWEKKKRFPPVSFWIASQSIQTVWPNQPLLFRDFVSCAKVGWQDFRLC